MDTIIALTAQTLTAIINAEDDYAAARAALAAAEERRYATIYAAVTEAGPAAVKAMTPATVTITTIRAAVRRHAAPSSWTQPELFNTQTLA